LSKSNTSQVKRPTWLIPAIIAAAVVLVLAIVAALSGSSRSPQVSGAPRAEVDQTSIDHGNVRFEQPVESTFHVRNTGDQPLTILGEPRVELVQGC